MFQESYMRKIAAAVGVMAVIALAAYTYGTMKTTRYMYSGPMSISVTGTGEVTAIPDIATFSFTVNAKEADAVTTQNKAAETMKAIRAYLAEQKVEEKDIKTSYYSSNPRYEYPQTVCTAWGCPPQVGEPKLIGYEVSQSVEVKVRDKDKVGELIGGVGNLGAQNISGVTFSIDDEDAMKAEAREKAIKDAEEKAEKLARDLGVRIVRMNNFWEEQGGGFYPAAYDMRAENMMDKAEVAMPSSAELPAGENTVTVKVNLSYEVR